jgi:hypothetical protein
MRSVLFLSLLLLGTTVTSAQSYTMLTSRSRYVGGSAFSIFKGGWTSHDSIRIVWSGNRGGDPTFTRTIFGSFDTSLVITRSGNDWVGDEKLVDQINGAGLLSKKTYYNWNSGGWEPEFNYNFDYDQDQNVTLIEYQVWNNGSFENVNRTKKHYYSENLADTIISQVWSAGAWTNSTLVVNQYNGQAVLTGSNVFAWSGTSWVNDLRHTYTYDGNNNLTEEMVEEWGTQGWLNHSRTIYTYENNHCILEIILLSVQGIWKNFEKVVSSYDASGNMISKATYYYQNNAWVGYSQIFVEFDTAGDMRVRIFQDWADSVWVNDTKLEYTYNQYHQYTTLDRYTWSGDWTHEYSEVCYYEEYDDEAGLATKDVLQVAISPNPFTHNLTISTKIPDRGLLRFTVYDNLGRVIFLRQTITDPGPYTLIWDGQSVTGCVVPAGIYVFSLDLGTYYFQGKIIKQ